MALKVANYTFSSWLRKGIANRITESDNLGAAASATKERSKVPIDVKLNTETVHKEFALIGPGDIIGINHQMVVRTEPINWITNFEPNYLAFIEFYDEDFIWRYTPARANDKRLRPWLALLVLKQADKPDDSEFTRDEKRLPLPTVTVKSAASLAPHDQCWAWGHVHTNEGYENPTEFEEFLLSLHDLNNPNADKIISRLMCPRKLDSDQAYRAFVVPAFETGRLAGLGQDVSNVDAQQPSWTAAAGGNIEFPIYYEWYFRTGEDEDFESLVKLLEPRAIDERVGRRDMDGSQPGFGMTTGTDLGPILPMTENQMIIGLEGALKSPETKSKPPAINTTKPFFQELESILNFPAELQASTNGSEDPVVCPPIYGENHALKHVIDVEGTGWLNELNRDPRNRVPSGFGTNVVQKHQEDYVARAWMQVKRILDINLRIRLSVFAMTTVQAIHTNFVDHLNAVEKMTFFAPVMKKVKGSPTTLYHQLENSRLPAAALDSSLRRLIRPRGAYGKRLREADPGFTHAGLIVDLNEGKISAAPPKQVQPDLPTDEKVVQQLPETKLPEWIKWLIRNRLLILILLLILLLLLGLLTGAWIVVAVLAILAVLAYVYASRIAKRLELATTITDPKALVEELKETPPQSDFGLVVTDPVVPIVATGGTQVTNGTISSSNSPDAVTFGTVTLFTPQAGGDSLEASNFREAAIKLNERLAVKAPERVVTRFDIENADKKLSAALDPRFAFPKMLAAEVILTFNPDWLRKPEHLVPAMAYPDFADPMYEKLRDISTELFLPNLELIPPNTISLLVTNPEFIESYMTGLNHEFGRELLWREYPTDQRGSYFRQFWDVKGIIAEDTGLSAEELADVYKDIEPLDEWTTPSHLGTHRNKKRPQGKQLVLVVRGELLKKYPNTIIYAQKAHIFKGKNGVADPNKEPIITEVKTEAEMKTEIKFPIFRAEIQPDFRFFGFDMTIEQARGDADPKLESDDWGWYFIIQQIPGEPRFGADIKFEPDEDPSTPITWDDLGWDNFADGIEFVNTSTKPLPAFFNKLSAAEKAQWGTHSADMAAVLYQKPVMIAVHAKEMLEKLKQT